MTGREKRGVGNSKGRKKEFMTHRLRLHYVFLSTDFILKKVFRKDGPPLGVEFDSLSSQAFLHCKKGRLGSKNSHRAFQESQRALQGNKGSRNCDLACNENQRAIKWRKVSEPTVSDYLVCNTKSASVKKHGIGKGLMTVWRAINPDGGDFPTGVNFKERESAAIFQTSTFPSQKPLVQEKKKSRKLPVVRKIGKLTKEQDKREPLICRRKVKGNTAGKQKQPRKQKCELALEVVRCQEDLEQFALLMDDEELEIRELQAGPNPLTCFAPFAINGLHGCSLCKDLLAKFPPNSVMMRLPFYMQPWGSSAEVFHFLYTYAVMFNICSFTIDEFAQAFNDKESVLLGKIHLALLKQLLSDLEVELSIGFFPHASKNGNFVELLHSVEHRQYVLKFWMKSLNPLTCTEILRQVFVAAGFGSKSGTLRKHTLNKEVNCMVKYGPSPDTLKGILFIILSEQGNNGMKVYDLAKSLRIVDLNLAVTSDELELLISSTLSSDITLFEKISHSAYRLRILSVTKEAENFELDPEDCGSIDEDSKDHYSYRSSDDSEYDPGTSVLSKLKRGDHRKTDNNMLTVDTEIDESHPGEVWLLGLMEGEYSDLSIEEKLNALVALVDLLSVGSNLRTEDPTGPFAECYPNNHYGYGAKIKRASGKQHKLATPFGGYCEQMLTTKELDRPSALHPKDSSASIHSFFAKANSCCQRKDAKETEVEDNLHPMQSIFLGSDRRYNRYWLFLGPCNANDPGHKSIYFESSEDGHWEVVDTEEALCTLLSALDCRGRREAHLLASLKKRETFLCQAMSSMLNDTGIRQLPHSDQSELNISREYSSSSVVSDVDNNHCLTEISKDFAAPSGAIVVEAGNKGEQQKQKWSRLQAFDAWIWSSFYYDLNAVKYGKRSYLDSLTRCGCCHDLYWRDEKHCMTCHTTFELDFDLEERYTIHAATCRENGKTNMYPEHKVLSSQLQLLKAAIHAIESVMPEGALVGAWTKSAHKLWVKRLRRTSTLAEFLQVLADFVDAINEERLCQQIFNLGSNSVLEEIIASFTTMPQTLSAVALWLVKLDALIAPHFQRILTEK
ncbi:homeobox-DDT domain protein RLT3-like isoform X2 [Actinidia eriantha]|uniref:homeobox-DDT domain protein RLT3-like isoform X2 n=1 Tax=Actinidia eriantha TaxID=165200 RepID=UPI0025852ADC|nr:homeobox-DDT domain protein RLT3-like isoform X2 [Actinidia eriantha]